MNMIGVKGSSRPYAFLLAASLFCIAMESATFPSAHAMRLTDEEWVAYFGSEGKGEMEYVLLMLTPFGQQEAIQRVKPKGVVTIDGKQYQEVVIIHDKGFLANKVIKRHERVTGSGLYERKEDGSESLIVPRPLEKGQTWTNQNEVRRFEGIEDFEVFNATIPFCAKITVMTHESDSEGKSISSKHTQYYERGKGMIYKGSENGGIGYTKLLKTYAAK